VENKRTNFTQNRQFAHGIFRTKPGRFLAGAWAILVLACAAQAQVDRAGLSGTVTDSKLIRTSNEDINIIVKPVCDRLTSWALPTLFSVGGAMTKILIVDDHAETVDALTILLESDDYTVVVAYDGSEALALLSTEKPDLVITDYKLPGVSGIDLIKSIRAPQSPLRHVPIIMLTGYPTESANQASDAGADRVVSKPVDPHIIVANVKILLNACHPATRDEDTTAG